MEDKIVRLKKIKELFDQGLVTTEEFNELKNEILGTIIDKSNTKVISNITAQNGGEKIEMKPTTYTNNRPIISKEGATKKSTNKNLPLYIASSFLILSALGFGIYFFSKNNNISTLPIIRDSTKVDTSRIVDNSSLSTNSDINEWLKKATGYNFNLDNSRVKFDANNYKLFDTSSKIFFSKPSDDRSISNISLIYNDNYIFINYRDDEGAGKSSIYLTSSFVIYSVHYVSTGNTQLFNLVTKKTTNFDAYVTRINGNEAEMVAGGHDNTGKYVILSRGIINLTTGEAKWDDEISLSNESMNGASINIENKSLGRFPQTSNQLISASFFSNLSKEDLKIMRNEIFARHGYIFKTPELKNYFKNQSWYKPQYNNVDKDLTEIEKKNILLIKQYE